MDGSYTTKTAEPATTISVLTSLMFILFCIFHFTLFVICSLMFLSFGSFSHARPLQMGRWFMCLSVPPPTQACIHLASPPPTPLPPHITPTPPIPLENTGSRAGLGAGSKVHFLLMRRKRCMHKKTHLSNRNTRPVCIFLKQKLTCKSSTYILKDSLRPISRTGLKP